MELGDLVRNICFTNLYRSIDHVNHPISETDVPIPIGSPGFIISIPNGTWVKWVVNGNIGWSYGKFLEVVQ